MNHYKRVVRGTDGRGYCKGKIPSDLRHSLPELGVRVADSSLVLPLQELPSSTGSSLARFTAAVKDWSVQDPNVLLQLGHTGRATLPPKLLQGLSEISIASIAKI